MRYPVAILAMTLAQAALAEDTSSFYFGTEIAAFDSGFEGASVTGDGTSLGLHLGYRHLLPGAGFLEAEAFADALDGRTSSGNTDFRAAYGVTGALGFYFAPRLSGKIMAGVAAVETTNTTTGSDNDSGTLFGIGLGYDLTPGNTLGMRYYRMTIEGDAGDVDSDVLGLRYTFRF